MLAQVFFSKPAKLYPKFTFTEEQLQLQRTTAGRSFLVPDDIVQLSGDEQEGEVEERKAVEGDVGQGDVHYEAKATVEFLQDEHIIGGDKIEIGWKEKKRHDKVRHPPNTSSSTSSSHSALPE